MATWFHSRARRRVDHDDYRRWRGHANVFLSGDGACVGMKSPWVDCPDTTLEHLTEQSPGGMFDPLIQVSFL